VEQVEISTVASANSNANRRQRRISGLSVHPKDFFPDGPAGYAIATNARGVATQEPWRLWLQSAIRLWAIDGEAIG
jgi:hypothetical protein